MGFKIFSTSASNGSNNNTQPALGYTPENVANKSTNVVTDQASNTKYPTVKAVFDWVTNAIAGFATQTWVNAQGFVTNVITALGYTPERISANATGSVIAFDAPKVYNTLASPGADDITNDLTGARVGVVQKIYHNKLVAPTFPPGWVLLGYYPYKAGSTNIIFAEWVGGTRVEYWIVRL